MLSFAINDYLVAGTGTLSESELIEKIPRSFDLMDLEEMRNLSYLIGLGEPIYPVLAKQLEQTKDPFFAGSIIAIFRESKGDKTLPVAAIRKTIGKWNLSESDEKRVVMDSLSTLGNIGSMRDAEVVFKVMSESYDVDVEIFGLQSLAKLGGPDTAVKISEWLKIRQKQGWPTEYARKAVMSESKTAIDQINLRSRKDSGSA